MTAYEALRKKYELEASLTAARERLEEAKETIPQLKAKKREADVALLEADSGLKRLFRKLAGKEEENHKYLLEQAARNAQAELDAALAEQKALEAGLASLEAEQAALGEKEALMAALSEKEKCHFLRLEASLCAEEALHHLRKCRKELEQAQYYARNPMMYPGEEMEENTHKKAAGVLADRCREKLQEIHSCGFPFDIHPYIQNPMGYIVTARRYGDQDQMNLAQKGIRETEIALKELLLQLAD